MLCSRFKQILLTKTTINNNVQFRCFINARFVSKRCGNEGFWASLSKHRKELRKMSSVRYIFRNIVVNRLWNAWSRSVSIGHVVKRCRKDRSVREVIHCFRQAFLRPRRTLLLSATAACKASDEVDEKPGAPPSSCSLGISDDDLQGLLKELDGVNRLAKRTLYCAKCSQRIVIDKKYPGIKYCTCAEPQPPKPSEGWMPYMEAEDVIIWRKEYKMGQGLFAYKVYGRYKDVQAQDYAAVNVDGAYRRHWDAAVAALSVVERSANGVLDQAVLHWEVLWPRLFANRDYVYIRRHKEYSVKSLESPHIFDDDSPKKAPATQSPPPPPVKEERPSVHSNAKKKSLEIYSKKDKIDDTANKVYVIISRSCTHPKVPETRNAIRVSEYWSHMIVRTIDGADKVGMEFVLTYYDEPAVGGMPSGVTAWATGRAAPEYLQRMRLAAKGYQRYRQVHVEDIPDFTPFRPETKKMSYDDGDASKPAISVKEEDMESSKTGPDMNNGHAPEDAPTAATDEPLDIKPKDLVEVKYEAKDEVKDEAKDEVKDEAKDEVKDEAKDEVKDEAKDKAKDKPIITGGHKIEKETQTPAPCPSKADGDKGEGEKIQEEQQKNNGGWWRYLYPFYYFV